MDLPLGERSHVAMTYATKLINMQIESLPTRNSDGLARFVQPVAVVTEAHWNLDC